MAARTRYGLEQLGDISNVKFADRPNKRRDRDNDDIAAGDSPSRAANADSASNSPSSESTGPVAGASSTDSATTPSRKPSKRHAASPPDSTKNKNGGRPPRGGSVVKAPAPAAATSCLPLHTFELSHNTFVGDANFSSSAHSSPRPAPLASAEHHPSLNLFGSGPSVFFDHRAAGYPMPATGLGGTTQMPVAGVGGGGVAGPSSQQAPAPQSIVPPVVPIQPVPPGSYVPFNNGYVASSPAENLYTNSQSPSAQVPMPRYVTPGGFDAGIWGE
jgi:hypothetical protein